MKKLTVYTRRTCGACSEAKHLLDNMQIPYQEVDIDAETDVGAWLNAQGYKFLPVLLVGDRELVPGGLRSLRTMRAHEILERIERI